MRDFFGIVFVVARHDHEDIVVVLSGVPNTSLNARTNSASRLVKHFDPALPKHIRSFVRGSIIDRNKLVNEPRLEFVSQPSNFGSFVIKREHRQHAVPSVDR